MRGVITERLIMTEPLTRVQYCPHCGNQAPQRLIHTQRHMEKTWSVSDGSEDEHPWSTFIVVCETCHQVLLYDNMGDQLSDKEFDQADLIYPKSGNLHHSVPELIRKVYQEAFRIKELAPNAFAVQIRRSLEAVCEDRGAGKGSLQKRLANLVDKGEIPPTLSELSDVLRLLGNLGAHGINESVLPIQAAAIDDFFRVIVEYVYVAPHKLNEFREKMEQYRSLRSSVEE